MPPEKAKVQVFKEYQEARGSLIERLGEYCCFCEMHLDAGLHVEHRLPKGVARYQHLERDWSNFLLSCVNCNSHKGSKDIKADDYLWPDTHNTFYAFTYASTATVVPNSTLPAEERRKARKLIKLVGMDRRPGNLKTLSDRRWLNRQEAWNMAQRMLNNLRRNDTTELRESIALNAKSKGYFSVWMTVFAADTDMLRRFIKAFPGTSTKCFDANGGCLSSLAR